MEQFLEFVVRQLTDCSEESKVASSLRSATEHGYILNLPASEVGKVIGKQGHTIRAIRSLLAAASRRGATATLEIIERPEP